MARETAHHLASYLHHLSSSARVENLSDRELVKQFAVGRDEDAFAALVRRHGPMVLRVCQRVLHDSHAAEDAFQATFLVFSRKAASLRCADTVGCFLHGVAFRVAQNARKQSARRLKHESRSAIEKQSNDPLADLSVREAQTILDEELARLPEKYRAPLVLCCLEGKSRDEAARQLGWSSKLVKSRLEDGRARLHQRLTRRGLTLSAALGATLMAAETVSAALPAALIRAAVQIARVYPDEGVSASVALLAESSLASTVTGKIKAIVGLLLLASAVAAGVGAFTSPQPATQAESQEPPAEAIGKPLVHRDRFGDTLPAEALARLGTIRFRHGGNIESLAFTPDGKMLVSCGSWDGLRFWDAATGKEVRRFPEQAQARNMALSPDGKTLAILVSSPDPSAEAIALHETASGRLVRRFGKQGGFGALRFSPDGKVLAAFNWPHTIELYDPATGRLLHTLKGHKDIVWSVAFSSDSKTLVSGSDDKTIRFWDVAAGKQVQQIAHNKGVGKVALSPDGKLLATIDETKEVHGSGASWHSENRVHLWDTATGKEVGQLVMPAKEIFSKVWGGFYSVGFAPDGKTIVTGAMDGTFRVWDPHTGRELRRVAGFAGAASAFAFAPDGKSIAVEDGHATIRLIDLTSGKDLLETHGHRSSVSSVVVMQDCQTVVTTCLDGTLRSWDAATGRELRRRAVPADYFAHPQLLSDGKTYLTVSSGKTIHVHDLASGDELAVLRGHDTGYPFALSPDRKVLASMSEDKSLHLLDPVTGKERHTLMKVVEYLPGMSFTPDSQTLVIWSEDKTVTVWDTVTGKKVRQFGGPGAVLGSSPQTYMAALSPDGKLLAFGLQILQTLPKTEASPGFVPLVDTLTGKEVRRFRELEDGAQLMAFSADGRMLAWSGWRDHTIYLGEIATGRVRRSFAGHKGSVESLAFSPDGKRLISGGNDTTALVWDLTGRMALGDKWGKPLADDDLKKHWTALAREDAAESYRAIQALAADPERSIPYLRQRLHPVAAVEEKRLSRLIADLDSERFDVREKATAELEKLGETALHAMQKALDGRPALEARRRLDQLIDKQVRERWSPSPERLRFERALEVLEQAGSPEARQVLRTLADGAPAARLTVEAKTALERLTHRSNTAR